MTVEADGVFYRDVISITQTAANKAVIVMPGESAELSIFSPIQIIGGVNENGDNSASGKTGRKNKTGKTPGQKPREAENFFRKFFPH